MVDYFFFWKIGWFLWVLGLWLVFKSVDDFKVYRSEGLFGSDGKSPYQYIEVLHINNFDSLTEDIQAEPKMLEVAQKFQSFAENPVFIVTKELRD